MKLRITIPQIRCLGVTHPKTAKDEIYVAYYATLAKAASDKTEVKKHAVKKVSEIKKGVKKGSKWDPKVGAIIETDGADSLIINLGIYEADDGKIYKKLVAGSDALIEPEAFTWSELSLPVDFTNYIAWLKAIWKLAVVSYSYLIQDDLLGDKSFAVTKIEGKDKNWLGTREFRFNRYGGDYRVMVCLEEVK